MTEKEVIQLAKRLNAKHGTGKYCPVLCPCGSYDVVDCNNIPVGFKKVEEKTNKKQINK